MRTTKAPLSEVDAADIATDPDFSLACRGKRLAVRIAAWMAARAERIGAEMVFKELSKLSDEELESRGLSRATLARDVAETVAERKRS